MVILSLEPLLRPTAVSKVIMEYAEGLSLSHLQPKVHGRWLVVWLPALGPVTHLPQAPAPISFYPRVCLSVCLCTSSEVRAADTALPTTQLLVVLKS